MNSILIIDDEPTLRKLLARILELEGYEVYQASDCASGMRQIALKRPKVILCDVFLPDGNGVELVKDIVAKYPDAIVVLLTAHGNIPDGVQAIKNGAFDYITKGDDNNKIIPAVSRAIDEANSRRSALLPAEADHRSGFDAIIGRSRRVAQSVELARKVAATDVPVLLTGETGTGKEVFANAIHRASLRSEAPFVAINCAAFSRELLESELFGHKAGAFTGALKDKKGLFEVANHGTIFLDEIGEMPVELQAKLLRVLEAGEYIKVGDTKVTRADVRIVSATNRNLKQQIERGAFREDLFFRLSVFQISLPALRERTDDIEDLAMYFVRTLQGKMGKAVSGITGAAAQRLKCYQWPGNIRELRNVVERALIICEGQITEADLPPEIQMCADAAVAPMSEFELADMERRHISKVLAHTGGNKAEAARLLKIGLTTLYRKIDEYGIRQ